MHRTYKRCNSKGFTLLEMVLVVLASSLMLGVSRYLNAANDANQDVMDASNQIRQELDDSEATLADYGF